MISKITIGFSRPKGRLFPVFSWLIRAHQRTPYSHCYLRFYSESLNRTLVYEAVGGGGVRFVSLALWSERAVEIDSFTVDVKKCNSTSLLQYCVDNAGVEYGWLQNLGLFLANVFGWKANPWKRGKNCSLRGTVYFRNEPYIFNNQNMQLACCVVSPDGISSFNFCYSPLLF